MGTTFPLIPGRMPDPSVAATSQQKCAFFKRPLTQRSQIVGLFDYPGREEFNRRNTQERFSTYVGAILAVYVPCRYSLQFATQKYVTVERITFRGGELVTPMPILNYTSVHKPTLARRKDEFPEALKPLLRRLLCLQTILSIAQLHPCVDNPEPFRVFAASRDEKSDSFSNIMFVVGRMRHMKALWTLESERPREPSQGTREF